MFGGLFRNAAVRVAPQPWDLDRVQLDDRLHLVPTGRTRTLCGRDVPAERPPVSSRRACGRCARTSVYGTPTL